MVLGVGDVLREPMEVGDQELHLDYGLGLVDTLDVALVCVLARRADGDGAIGPQHLELDVVVVGDRHELGVAWPP